MKIFSVSLGRNGTQSLSKYLTDQGFSTTHFYKFSDLEPGSFSEDEEGILKHFDLVDNTDAHVDIPTCLVFDKMYERFPDAKFINITRAENDWVSSMIKMRRLMGHDNEPYVFEEAYCNFYLKTGKKKIQDLNEDELILIRKSHLERISVFFKDKPNYLEVDLKDPKIAEKIKQFLKAEKDIPFPNEDRFR